MKLDAARLCLDCEEIHEAQVCPVCSSEAFAYLTRWVQPSIDRDRTAAVARSAEVASTATPRTRSPEQVEAYRQLIEGKPRRRTGLVTGGVLGLAAVSLAGWAMFRKRDDAVPVSDVEPPDAPGDEE